MMSANENGPGEVKDYQRQYYESNFDKISQYKREKYATDPQYKENAQIRAKRQYWFKTRPEKLKDKKFIELAEVKPVGVVAIHVGKGDNDETVTVTSEVYTSSAVGQLLGKSQQTVRIWQKEGILPEPRYRRTDFPDLAVRGNNPRLYTRDEMEILAKAREYLLLPSPTLKSGLFTEFVAEEFAKLEAGVIIPGAE